MQDIELVGLSQEVLKRFYNLLAVMAQAGTMSHADSATSLTLFAREVLPRLSDHMRGRARQMGHVE